MKTKNWGNQYGGRYTTEDFIRNSKKKFKDKFTYDNTHYITMKDNIIITCNIHGNIETSANSHLVSKTGCSFCGNELQSNKKRMSLEEFIYRANIVHNYKYDYSKTEYINSKRKIIIICNCGNEFLQAAGEHLYGAGCPKCGLKHSVNNGGWSKSEWIASQKDRISKLYVVKIIYDNEEFIKIGITHKRVSKRLYPILKLLDNSCYEEIKVIKSADAGLIYDKETHSKKTLKKFRYKPSVKFSGHTECYKITPEVLDYISTL